MHGTALYELRDLGRLPPPEAGAVREYLARERAWQERLLALLGADYEQAKVNQRLLFAWDGLSLGLCLRWDDYAVEDLVRLEPLPAGAMWWTHGRSRPAS